MDENGRMSFSANTVATCTGGSSKLGGNPKVDQPKRFVARMTPFRGMQMPAPPIPKSSQNSEAMTVTIPETNNPENEDDDGFKSVGGVTQTQGTSYSISQLSDNRVRSRRGAKFADLSYEVRQSVKNMIPPPPKPPV